MATAPSPITASTPREEVLGATVWRATTVQSSKPSLRSLVSPAAAIASILFLGGCVSTPITKPTCPPEATKPYAKDFQKQAASDLRKLPAGSPVHVLVNDLGAIRAECRALK